MTKAMAWQLMTQAWKEIEWSETGFEKVRFDDDDTGGYYWNFDLTRLNASADRITR
ncbi:MAG: hypothetical protein M3Y72_09485 [Acidobacteriota bacterium]|nr:hypothetical protein [Acidobacteriota bacterium]